MLWVGATPLWSLGVRISLVLWNLQSCKGSVALNDDLTPILYVARCSDYCNASTMFAKFGHGNLNPFATVVGSMVMVPLYMCSSGHATRKGRL